MTKLRITSDDKKDFKKTINGQKKVIWMAVGMLIDFLATLSISLLNIFANKLPNSLYYYIILFILLVIVVFGGEMIGVYYGALEEYVYNKKHKKILDINE